nr:MAG TPA: hypothetical protein [Inoviridae sp.]
MLTFIYNYLHKIPLYFFYFLYFFNFYSILVFICKLISFYFNFS